MEYSLVAFWMASFESQWSRQMRVLDECACHFKSLVQLSCHQLCHASSTCHRSCFHRNLDPSFLSGKVGEKSWPSMRVSGPDSRRRILHSPVITMTLRKGLKKYGGRDLPSPGDSPTPPFSGSPQAGDLQPTTQRAKMTRQVAHS